jgi:hypothetical protein
MTDEWADHQKQQPVGARSQQFAEFFGQQQKKVR